MYKKVLKVRYIIFLSSVFFFTSILNAQEKINTVFEDGRTIYVKENTFSINIHNSGWGVNYRKATFKGALYKNLWNFGFSSLSSFREVPTNISSSSILSLGSSFVYGKINSIISFRLGKGFQKTIFEKQSSSAIDISYILSGGISLIYAKPIFVNVRVERTINGRTEFIDVTEKYDPSKHVASNITAKSFYLKGLTQGTFFPSIYVKGGLQFEFSIFADKVSAFELGMIADISYNKIPIFYENSANSFFMLNLYLAIAFGNKTER